MIVTAADVDKHSNRVIQGLWIGSALSAMERLSIASFLANGHEFHLYVYSGVQDVPVGTVIRDGNEIMPSSAIFTYRDDGSYAGFANFFRYELLLKCGGWWVDLDTVCLQPFTFEEEYVIGVEPVAKGGEHPTNAMLKAPPGSDLMMYLTHACRNKDCEKLTWGETGPRLVAAAVQEFSLQAYLQPHATFCPIGWYDWKRAIDPGESISFGAQTCAIHLWHEMWRRNSEDKNAPFHPDCIYERLKAKYL